MFKIFVPTDFSANANNALNYAIEIANMARGSITLYHVYNVPSATGSFISLEGYIKRDAEREMANLIDHAQKRLSEGAQIEGKVTTGSVTRLVCDRAERGNYQLIVMGTQGVSGLKGIFIGSVAAGVMNRTALPVMAIPKDVRFKPLSKIVLAMDDNPISDDKILEPLYNLTELFNSELIVFHLKEREAVTAENESINQLFPMHTYFEKTFDAQKKINEMIDEFAFDSEADALCLIRRKRGALHELFNTSVTKKEMHYASIPILILHD